MDVLPCKGEVLPEKKKKDPPPILTKVMLVCETGPCVLTTHPTETFRGGRALERYLLLGSLGLPPRPATHLVRGNPLVILSRPVHPRSM